MVTTEALDAGDSPYNPPLSGPGAPAAASEGVEFVLSQVTDACADGSTRSREQQLRIEHSATCHPWLEAASERGPAARHRTF